jgi:uncharacterized membrane protein
MFVTMKTLVMTLVVAIMAVGAPVSLMANEALWKKCSVTVVWKKRGEDATVTVTVKNGTKNTLTDPSVRVTFYDKEGNEVAADSKGYFGTIRPGASKRMEARIWTSIPAEATTAKGAVDGGFFE